MNDLKEQLNERKLQVEELQLQLGKREEELAQSMMRIDEEGAGIFFLDIFNFEYKQLAIEVSCLVYFCFNKHNIYIDL